MVLCMSACFLLTALLISVNSTFSLAVLERDNSLRFFISENMLLLCGFTFLYSLADHSISGVLIYYISSLFCSYSSVLKVEIYLESPP